jgi:hypothetical protein
MANAPAPEPEAPAPDSSDDGYNPFNISDTASDDSDASDVSNQMQCPRCGVTESSDNFEYVPFLIDHPNAVAPNDCLENDRDFCTHCATIVLNTPGETGNYCEDNPDCVDCAADRAEQEQVPVPAPDAEAALEAGEQNDSECGSCGQIFHNGAPVDRGMGCQRCIPDPEPAPAPALVYVDSDSLAGAALPVPVPAPALVQDVAAPDSSDANREQQLAEKQKELADLERYLTVCRAPTEMRGLYEVYAALYFDIQRLSVSPPAVTQLDWPDWYLCTITQDVMIDPVVNSITGFTYDRVAIERWCAGHPRIRRGLAAPDPQNPSADVGPLVRNFSLANAFEQWCTDNNVQVPMAPAPAPVTGPVTLGDILDEIRNDTVQDSAPQVPELFPGAAPVPEPELENDWLGRMRREGLIPPGSVFVNGFGTVVAARTWLAEIEDMSTQRFSNIYVAFIHQVFETEFAVELRGQWRQIFGVQFEDLARRFAEYMVFARPTTPYFDATRQMEYLNTNQDLLAELDTMIQNVHAQLQPAVQPQQQQQVAPEAPDDFSEYSGPVTGPVTLDDILDEIHNDTVQDSAVDGVYVEYIISTGQQSEVHYVHITDPEELELFYANDPPDNFWDFEQRLQLRLEYGDVMEGDHHFITRQQYVDSLDCLDGTFLSIRDIHHDQFVRWDGRDQPAVYDLIYQHEQVGYNNTSHQWLPELALEELHSIAVTLMAPMRGIQIPTGYSIVRRSTGEVIALRHRQPYHGIVIWASSSSDEEEAGKGIHLS